MFPFTASGTEVQVYTEMESKTKENSPTKIAYNELSLEQGTNKCNELIDFLKLILCFEPERR
jgi:hypothetical protein